MTERQIIEFLQRTGHLEFPFNERYSEPWPASALDLDHAQAREAVMSFQAMHTPLLEQLVAKHHPDRKTPVVKVDGDPGPATVELMESPRCACEDYSAATAEPAVGGGNWQRCWDIGEFHAAVVKINTAGMPAFLTPIWNEVWSRVVKSYEEIGLRFIRRDDAPNPNIDISFVTPDSSWIGLAIVGQQQKCSDRIWAKFDKGYRPANLLSEWSTLVRHELGHNCGLSHSSGGTMNPYIIKGLPVSWRGDPSEPLLKQRFGGLPIPTTPQARELVVAWRYPDGRYELVSTIPQDGGSGPFPL